MILFWDSETTGLPMFDRPSHLPEQPDIVQLTALVTDNSGVKRGSIDLLIEPDGWTIPPEITKINGLTTDICQQFGVPIELALDAFFGLLAAADLSVAWNHGFDAKMVRIALKKVDQGDPLRADILKNYPKCDPMHKATKIVNLPPSEKMMASGRRTPKTPKLTEAYLHFFGEEIEGAHNAAKDVLALHRIYFHMRDRGML